jgi:hypothetical protein
MSLSSPKILRGAAFLAVVAFTALPAVAQGTDDMTCAQEMLHDGTRDCNPSSDLQARPGSRVS